MSVSNIKTSNVLEFNLFKKAHIWIAFDKYADRKLFKCT